MIKHSAKALQNVPETLLFTLYMRYRESKKPDGMIKDPRYEEIINKIDYDFSRFDDLPDQNTLFVVRRSILFDNITRAHIEKNPEAVIVSFGSGLDFRFDRIDNGHIEWFDIELPEVIELRKKIFQETDHAHYIPVSVLDYSWADSIPARKNIFFIAEGLFMYLAPEKVREILIHLLENFPGSTLLFDVYTTLYFELSKDSPHPFIKKMVDMWKWASNDWFDIENWDHRIKLIDEWIPVNLYKDRPADIEAMISNFEAQDYMTEEITDQIIEQIIKMCRIGLIQLGDNKLS